MTPPGSIGARVKVELGAGSCSGSARAQAQRGSVSLSALSVCASGFRFKNCRTLLRVSISPCRRLIRGGGLAWQRGCRRAFDPGVRLRDQAAQHEIAHAVPDATAPSSPPAGGDGPRQRLQRLERDSACITKASCEEPGLHQAQSRPLPGSNGFCTAVGAPRAPSDAGDALHQWRACPFGYLIVLSTSALRRQPACDRPGDYIIHSAFESVAEFAPTDCAAWSSGQANVHTTALPIEDATPFSGKPGQRPLDRARRGDADAREEARKALEVRAMAEEASNEVAASRRTTASVCSPRLGCEGVTTPHSPAGPRDRGSRLA